MKCTTNRYHKRYECTTLEEMQYVFKHVREWYDETDTDILDFGENRTGEDDDGNDYNFIEYRQTNVPYLYGIDTPIIYWWTEDADYSRGVREEDRVVLVVDKNDTLILNAPEEET